jgi:hypothetical protein
LKSILKFETSNINPKKDYGVKRFHWLNLESHELSILIFDHFTNAVQSQFHSVRAVLNCWAMTSEFIINEKPLRVCLDEIIKKNREFKILSNSNNSIWITFIYKFVCSNKVKENFCVNILGQFYKFKKFWIIFKIWK